MLEGILAGIIDPSLLRKAMQSCSGVDKWHYTSKHGSWLNLAESELGVLAVSRSPHSRQAHDRR